ncbi:HAD-IA family hydrolase [Shewanella psychropiezotolerans]|uniref:HAD-IA family hydrolase n=1 Tax=Shewanella psychropiezotolerans TaxID=2593655 RepID=A0ABX5X1G9_9GAMM|nr:MULTISPECIES: HAD-IA family hydrolase [Shewanella]MPY26291.1 HAD-IA family hydrolase [Shewanella sp. YLB-07]QDO84557.1 HAD-IA family hydrolase [Shewanella psychropiezotolerans]
MKQYELVIFDWDGTLMDSVGKIVACMQESALTLNMLMPTEQAVRDIIGLSMDEALSILHPDASALLQGEMKEVYRQQYLQLNQTPSPLFDGVEDLLTTLNGRGYKLAVATGKARAGLNRVLIATELGGYFVASRCADEAASKPSPEMILQLLNELDVSPDKAVMIGDSIHDLNMANNAGIHAIGVDYGAHDKDKLSQAKPKVVISSPMELLEHLTS